MPIDRRAAEETAVRRLIEDITPGHAGLCDRDDPRARRENVMEVEARRKNRLARRRLLSQAAAFNWYLKNSRPS